MNLLFLEARYNGDVATASQRSKEASLETKNEALQHAAWNGHLDIVHLLLEDPCVQNDAALENAASKGFADIVRLLLPRVADPAIDMECVGSEEVFMLFLNDERIKETFKPAQKQQIAPGKDQWHANSTSFLPWFRLSSKGISPWPLRCDKQENSFFFIQDLSWFH